MEFDQLRHIKKEQFEALFQLNRAIGELDVEQELLPRILDVVLKTIKASRGFIASYDPVNEKFHLQTARNIAEEDIRSLQEASSSIFWEVIRTGKTVLSTNALLDDRFKSAESVIMHDIRSVIALPLKRHGNIEGVIYLDSSVDTDCFFESSRDFLNFFSNMAALVLENTILYKQVCSENILLKKEISQHEQFEELVGESEAIQKVYELIKRVSRSDASILILGESGTGKELAAKAIHNRSRRAKYPFWPQDCGALAQTLAESELFGYVRGAFTGAVKDKPGLFELTNGGTFFLDEIGNVSNDIQAKFLRVLQSQEIKRVGETRMRRVDVRIIAATNKNLWEMVKNGSFREDLYYRLNVVSLEMPPLRQRKSDIPLLAAHFIKKHNNIAGTDVNGISEKAIKLLMKYDWPGNVRELENAVKRAMILADAPILQPDDFMFLDLKEVKPSGQGTLAENEKKIVLDTLKEFSDDKKAAAKYLGVSLRWLYYRLKEWGIEDQ